MTDATKTPKTTSAQRQAALRQRARSLAYGIEDEVIGTAPDTALLEALPIAYRLKQAAVLESIMVDLLRRLGSTVTVTRVKPTEVQVEPTPVTVTTPATDRDARIIAMRQAGESNRAIARTLDCSEGTVRNVIKRYPATCLR